MMEKVNFFTPGYKEKSLSYTTIIYAKLENSFYFTVKTSLTLSGSYFYLRTFQWHSNLTDSSCWIFHSVLQIGFVNLNVFIRHSNNSEKKKLNSFFFSLSSGLAAIYTFLALSIIEKEKKSSPHKRHRTSSKQAQNTILKSIMLVTQKEKENVNLISFNTA